MVSESTKRPCECCTKEFADHPKITRTFCRCGSWCNAGSNIDLWCTCCQLEICVPIVDAARALIAAGDLQTDPTSSDNQDLLDPWLALKQAVERAN